MLLRLPVSKFRFKSAACAGIVFAAAGLVLAQTASAADSTPAAMNYQRNCAICHGPDGAGTALGKKLKTPDLRGRSVQKKNAKTLVQAITGGKNNMPPFGDKFKGDEIDALVDYVRQFRAGAASPAK